MKKYVIFLLLLLAVQLASGQAIPPSIKGDEKISATEDTLITLNWTVTDDNLASYTIVMNGTDTVGTGSYEDDESTVPIQTLIQLNIRLNKGTFTLELKVVDFDGLEAKFSTEITTNKAAAPEPGILPFDSTSMFLGLVFAVATTRIINRRREK